MSKIAEYLEHAHRCMMLADRYAGSQTETSLLAAAASWRLLIELESRADSGLAETTASDSGS